MNETTAAAELAGLAGPVHSNERISSLDVLRGVAVLGILLVNIYAFAMPFPGPYNNPYLMGGTDALNLGSWFFTRIFVDQKFLTIFSMLFGAGIILMSGRAERRGSNYGRIFYRRQFWLLVIGALHAYLIWGGDILFTYAVVGMVVYLFRKRTPRSLVIIALCTLVFAFLMSYVQGTQLRYLKEIATESTAMLAAGDAISTERQRAIDAWQENQAYFQPDADSIREETAIFLGSYAEIFVYRAPQVLALQTLALAFFLFWRIAPIMLLGMALMKTGVLAAEKSADFYRKLMWIGFAIGLPLSVFSAYDSYVHDFDGLYAYIAGNTVHFAGATTLAIGYIAMLILMLKNGYAQRLLKRFAAVGRMALTNYLLHSVILTTVFYGYGFGLFASVPRFALFGFVLAVIGLQLLYSPWWLARYRFGPVEWLWRSLTYWERQPMRHKESA